MKQQLQKWIQSVKPDDFKAKYAVRTTCMVDLSIRVRIELADRLGQSAPGVPDLFIGPFKNEEEADREGRNIARIVREALGLVKQ